MRKTQFRGVLMLLLTAFIWGSAFVAQSVGMESAGAFTFNGIRTLLGFLVLLPYIIYKEIKSRNREEDKKVIKYGIILGVILCIASNFQQFAFTFEGASSGKIAFITAFYMFFVPLFGLAFKKKIPLITWLCVLGGTVGLYFLCVGENGFGSITMSDIFALICSVFFALHILLIEKFASDTDPIKLSAVQFLTSGLISVVLMFIFEEPDLSGLKECAVPLMYSGFLSCGLAYTFQIAGQKYTDSTAASLILCLESVFGVLCGAVFLKDILSLREITGCVIMFISIVLSILSGKIQEKKKITVS